MKQTAALHHFLFRVLAKTAGPSGIKSATNVVRRHAALIELTFLAETQVLYSYNLDGG